MAAVRSAGRSVSWWGMAKAVMQGVVPRRIWLQRLSVCAQCPVLDRARMVCWNESLKAGCHCYVPMKAVTAGQCWAKEVGLENEGWGAYRKTL